MKTFDLTSLFRLILLLLAPGQTLEMRAFDRRGNSVAGYFAPARTEALRIPADAWITLPIDFDSLHIPNVEQSAHATRDSYDHEPLIAAFKAALDRDDLLGVYFTLNPVSPALHARIPNKLKDNPGRLTTDADIVSRRWLFIDLDPVRPSGCSASEAEQRAALLAMMDIHEYLRALGWPEPVRASSGNGFHLLYRIDLPNDEASAGLIRQCLKALSSRFSTSAVTVDEAVWNASRIIRFYGTVARKGENTAERPHRRSMLWDNGPGGIVSVDQLKILAQGSGAKTSSGSTRVRLGVVKSGVNVTSELAKRGLLFDLVEKDGKTYHNYHVLMGKCLFKGGPHENGSNARNNEVCGFCYVQASRELYHTCFACQDKEGGTRKALAGLGIDPKDLFEGEEELCTDLGNARRFARQYAGRVKYVWKTRQWYVWVPEMGRWMPDEGVVMHLAQLAVAEILKEAFEATDSDRRKELASWGLKSQFSSRIDALVRQARALPDLRAEADEFDRDPWLLNFANGTYELRTGEFLPHRREDMLSKISPVCYDPNAESPDFLAFIRRIFPDQELQAYVRRALGYSLTGDTSEQCLFIAYGAGANGKTTLFELMMYVLGDYARTADFESLMASSKGRAIRNDIARLQGARLAKASEAGEGDRLNEALIKQLTGSETVTARFLYQEEFEFKAQFKIWMATNHKPKILGTDDGVWRRMRLIPFSVQIPKAEQDRNLSEKLRAEAPGFLNWALQGLRDWQTGEGLREPRAVVNATMAYRNDQDIVWRFIGEGCIRGPEKVCSPSMLRRAFETWCEENGIAFKGDFPEKLKDAGFKQSKSNGKRLWVGIGLIDERQQSEM